MSLYCLVTAAPFPVMESTCGSAIIVPSLSGSLDNNHPARPQNLPADADFPREGRGIFIEPLAQSARGFPSPPAGPHACTFRIRKSWRKLPPPSGVSCSLQGRQGDLTGRNMAAWAHLRSVTLARGVKGEGKAGLSRSIFPRQVCQVFTGQRMER